MAFAPDGRLFYAEHWTGNIRILTPDGNLLTQPFAHVESGGINQLGFSGLAIDPEFESNHYVYAYFFHLTAPGSLTGSPMVVRFTDSANVGEDETVIVDKLPEKGSEHPFSVNGALHFGPDGFLYLTLGDYDVPDDRGPLGLELPQDLGTPIGKVLRVNKEDGSAAPGNPFLGQTGVDERIYAYGFRQPFDFTFHPQSRRMYGGDNNAGVTCEELNIVKSGGNHGWPQGQFPYVDCDLREQVPAIHYFSFDGRAADSFESAVAVTGMEFISGSAYPTLGDSLLVCESRTQLMRRLVLSGPGFDQVTGGDVLANDCWWDIAVSPDGIAYYSNLMEIRRLIPPETASAPTP